MRLITFTTDEATREQFPDELDLHATGIVTAAMLQRLAELEPCIEDDATVYLMRDWENVPIVVVDDSPSWPLTGLYLTEQGRIAEGGVNIPRYFDNLAALLDHYAHSGRVPQHA
jgi:hypothetical protein